LSRRGKRVVLLERERRFGAHSSGLNAGILRTVTSDPVATALTQRGAAFLHEPPEELLKHAGGPLLDPRGVVLTAGHEAAELTRWIEAAGPETEAHELSGDDLLIAAPHYRGDPKLAVLFPREGTIDIARLVTGFARGAEAAGAELRRRTTVRRLLVDGDRVAAVELADGTRLAAERTVLAAGGWARRLGAEVGSRVRMQPTRRHLFVTASSNQVDPRWPVVWDLDRGFYCRPERGGLMLCVCDQSDTDPDACTVDPDVGVLIRTEAERLLRLPLGRQADFWCSLRTMTEDSRFVLGPDPDIGGLFWVAGLGGSGMACGAEVGRLAAAMLAGEAEEDPLLAALEPGRLAA
ncbi:MAG: FAD-binding oxidoreductase, partial [Planctomycetota bacterium]|nr:FAD-binding oxidoreductase [Planctomycetota bacterium]